MAFSAVQKTSWGLVATALTFSLAVAANGFLAYRLNEVKIWTLHTHRVIEELDQALLALQELESDDRGYAISSNPIFLQNCQGQRRAVVAHLDTVAKMVVDNPAQDLLLDKARGLAQQKLAFTDTIFKATDHKAALALIDTGRGALMMINFRNQIKTMIANEEALLRVRSSDLTAIQRTNWFATALLGAFSIFLLIWVFRVSRQAVFEEQKRVAVLQSEIEERKRVEKDLISTTQKLISSNTDLQQFAYVASHDLQEPLRAVAGFLTLIVSKNKGKLDPETEGFINHAVEGAQRMRTLISDLLSYARVESQGKELVPVDCNASLQQARKDLLLMLEESAAEIVSDNLPRVIGDEGQLAQVFQNLIANAIKFRGPDNPVVKIRTLERQGEWQFSVQDNGIGFEEEHATRIFVIFQRLHGRDEFKGTGIGLALCKKIIERHGGHIWAQSQPQKGSTFYFTIPVLPGGISERTAQSAEKNQSTENSLDRG